MPAKPAVGPVGRGPGARGIPCLGCSGQRGAGVGACPQGGRSGSPREAGALEPWAAALAVRFRSWAAGP